MIRRRMMSLPFSSTTPAPTRYIRLNVPSNEASHTTFIFRKAAKSEMAFIFPPRLSPSRPQKRCRPVADVDGEHSCVPKKKRRLRLFLITSRLSPHYSQPATNIVDRGSSKIAVWAKQKSLGRDLILKAAILNRIRRYAFSARETSGGLGSVLVEQEREQDQLRRAELTFKYGSYDSMTHPGRTLPPSLKHEVNTTRERPPRTSFSSRSKTPSPPSQPHDYPTSEYRSPNDAYFDSTSHSRSHSRSYLPSPPSPLRLTNYDALDEEDDIPDPYAYLDDEYERDGNTDSRMMCPFDPSPPSHHPVNRSDSGETLEPQKQTIYSDFNILDSDEPTVGDHYHVKGGTDNPWPSTFASEVHHTSPPMLPSSPPDFHTLFINAQAAAATISHLTSLTATVLSPNFSSPLRSSPGSASPNFAFPMLADEAEVQGESMQHNEGPGSLLHRRNSDFKAERERQKRIMFTQFDAQT
jgi:hypothetical protein